MAEAFGVEGRGRFYESVGALRDVFQNHLLQVVALLAMEPPVSADEDALRDEKVRLWRQIRAIDPAKVVRGQYRGYVDEPGVEAGSDVETFVALQLEIESWRWAGVPWLVRTGKSLPVTATEAVVTFAAPPRLLFAPSGAARPEPEPAAVPARAATTASPCSSRPRRRATTWSAGPSTSRCRTSTLFPHRQEAYQRLLEDAMEGDHRRFGRADGVEEQWRIVEQVLDDPPAVELYRTGHVGPGRAPTRLAAPVGGWVEPLADD